MTADADSGLELAPGGNFVLAAPMLVKSVHGGGGTRIVEGVMSTDDPDFEGERMPEPNVHYQYMLRRAALNKSVLDQMDFSNFETRHGWVKWEHPHDSAHNCRSCGEPSCFREPETIIGWPREVEKSFAFTDPLSGMPKIGTRLVAELFGEKAENPFADGAWRLLNSIAKSNCPKRVGWSIEGAHVVPIAEGVAQKCLVTGVVLTTKPVNTHTWAQVRKSLLGCSYDDPSCTSDCCAPLRAVHKAVMAGHVETPSAKTGGAALATQSHQGLKSKCRKRGCDDPAHDHSERRELASKSGRRAALAHLLDLGVEPEVAVETIRRRLAA